MVSISNELKTAFASDSRRLKGKVELFNNSTSTLITSQDKLKSIQVSRYSNEKVFGFALCQKATIEIIDENHDIEVAEGQKVNISIGAKIASGVDYVGYCDFFIDRYSRDEVSHLLKIEAFDRIQELSRLRTSQFNFSFPMALEEIIFVIQDSINIEIIYDNNLPNLKTIFEKEQINIEGTESIRSFIEAICELTGTICYINQSNQLVLKKIAGDTVNETINRDRIFDFSQSEGNTITGLISATELGNNLSVGSTDGYQYIIRENPFLTNDQDLCIVCLNNLLTSINGFTFNPYELKWRGSPDLEAGDRVKIQKKDGTYLETLYLGEELTYNGGLISNANWAYIQEEEPSNPSNLGDILKQTYARVDKVNKQIDIAVAGKDEIEDKIAKLQLTTDSISATVSSNKAETDDRFNSVNDNLNALAKSVSATMTQDQINILIQQQLANNVNSVTTTTGFTFNADGLTIEKSGNEMKTQIDEDGMTIFKDNQEVLTVNNTGVDAYNLKATTYLIIGNETRFEKFNHKMRGTGVGCFWLKDAPTVLTVGGEANGNQFSQNNWR